MARSQLDFRKQFMHEAEIGGSAIGGFDPGAAGAEGASSILVQMDSEPGFRHTALLESMGTRERLSMACSPRGEDQTMGEFAAAPEVPGQGNVNTVKGWITHDDRNVEVIVPGAFGEVAISSTSRGPESLGGAGGWNNNMLSHRRCNSAPNISSISSSSSSWRAGAGLPCLTSGALAADLREHTIPEGRRFEALEPPLQPSIAGGRPRSWRARTTAPPWGTGPASAVDFGNRDPHSTGAVDLVPKLRASYFVNVRGQGEAPATTSASTLSSSKTLTIGGLASANSRPFEEIKRMRLSQALEGSGAPHFDAPRLTPRFSPGKGVKVAGFSSALKCRPPSFGGPGGLNFGPLSPALTEPPTPPSLWKMQEPEAFASKSGDGGSCGHVQGGKMVAPPEQGVLPMAQRPMDEVNAVQALMSVGLGTTVGLGTMAHTEASEATVAMETSETTRNQVPSLERLKPFEGGGDDDDDGLDKDLWVVVEKGSVCASPDCVYRDAAGRIASRRHYHSKCTHTHNGGEKKGMVFHHHQLEKVQKHQRSHKREATKSAPYKRTTPEDHQAMEGAGIEGYRPGDWSPEETRQLDELVNQLVAPVTHAWPSIARFFPTKTSIQCLLHWRFTLNDNGIIRGNGTWGAEEDERLRKLAPVFSSPSTGPRWAKIAEVMPGRTAKQCRERYNNHVDPGIKKDKIWSAEEDALVMRLHAEHHNQFAKIARSIPGRCYDDVKNRFNLLVKRRQLVSKSANSNQPDSGNKVPSSSAAERSGATEHRVPPPFEGTATAGLFRNPGVAEQSLVTSRGGVKRATPETPGR